MYSPLGIVYTGLLEGFGEDGDSRVDRIGNDEDERLGASLCDRLSEGRADTSVDLQHRYC